MNFFKSHFSFNKRQRNGVFFLLLLIVALQLTFFYADFSTGILIIPNNQIAEFKLEMDSLKKIELENRKPKIYPFNPNYISDFKGYQLGMSLEEIDRLHSFREKNNFVNSAKQFQKVTQVSDSLLNLISPNFKFPGWVISKASEEKNNSKYRVQKTIIKRDINLINSSDFKSIKGIGAKLATRIVNYRTKLQGFSRDDQLYEVWYLDKVVADRILKNFEVKELPKILKLNINEATFKQLLSIVYIDYELTKKIVNYRDEVAEIQSLEELKKIEGFPIEKFERIALYLVAE